MYGAVQTFQGPTTVTHALRGRFLPSPRSDPQWSLVLIRSSILDLYCIRASAGSSTARFEHQRSTELHGVVASAAVVSRRGNWASDTLMLGFGGLKVAALVWDAQVFDWVTIQIWEIGGFVERAGGLESGVRLVHGRSVEEGKALVLAEGRGRCAAVVGMEFDLLVVMEMKGEDEVRWEACFEERNEREVLVAKDQVYYVDLWHYGIKNVKAAVYLLGTFEPTLLLLSEPKRTWSGRSAKAKWTAKLTALKLTTTTKSHEQLWSLAELPYDAFDLVPVPEHAGGGVLVLAPSLILHVRHGAVASGLSLNSFGDGATERYDSVVQSDILLSADCAKCEFMDCGADISGIPGTAISLLALKGGELYFITVGAGHGISMVRAGSTVIGRAIVPINSRLFVLASRLADTLLIEYRKSSSSAGREPNTHTVKSTQSAEEELQEYRMMYGTAPPETVEESSDANNKSQAEDGILTLESGDKGTRGVYDDSDELGWVFASSSKKFLSWALIVKDTLKSFGPGSDASVALTGARGPKVDFVIAGGYAKNGCVAIVNKSISVNEQVRFSLKGCEGAWTVCDKDHERERELKWRKRREVTEKSNAQIRVRNKEIEILRKQWVQGQLNLYRNSQRADAEGKASPQSASHVDGSSDSPRLNGSEEPPLKKLRRDNYNSNEIKGGLSANGQPESLPQDENHQPLGNDIEENLRLMKIKLEEQVNTEHPYLQEEPLEADAPPAGLDSYLLLTTGDSTILLETDEDLVEMSTSSGICRDARTVVAGNVLGSSAFVQVTRQKVLLICALECVDTYVVSAEASIVSAEIEDPWIALLLSDGSAVFLEVQQSKDVDSVYGDEDEHGLSYNALGEPESTVRSNKKLRVAHKALGGVSNVGIYKGPLGSQAKRVDPLAREGTEKDSALPDDSNEMELDEEELMLYGETGVTFDESEKTISKDLSAEVEDGVFPSEAKTQYDRNGTLFVVVRGHGRLELTGVDGDIRFRSSSFHLGPPLLLDEGSTSSETESVDIADGVHSIPVQDVQFKSVIGNSSASGLVTSVLVASLSSGIVVYKAFLSPEAEVGHSRLKFFKVLDPYYWARTHTSMKSEGAPRFTFFNQISSRGGFFIDGRNPAFVFCERGFPRIHPLSQKQGERSPVKFFSSFNNINCREGMIMGVEDVVQISDLFSPHEVSYAGEMPLKKIGVRCTVHKVCYHGSSGCYGVLASMPTLTNREERLARIIQSLEKHDKRHYQNTVAQAEAAGDSKRVPELYEEIHELRLYRADGMEMIRSHKLQNGEVGLCLANISVTVFKQRKAEPGFVIAAHNKADDGGESLFAASGRLRPKDMLVVGTGYLNGEDASSRGRLLMFEVSRQESYTENGGTYTAFQMQLISEKTCTGPVTAVAALEGYVVCGVGPQVHVYKLVGDEIVHLSFAFAQLYITSIASLKQYITIVDMFKSIEFMYWRERNNSVNFLAKDYEHLEAYATEYLIDEEKLSFVISDSGGNIQLMDYAHASNPETRGGTRLLSNGGVHVGGRINKFIRTRLESNKPKGESGAGTHATLFPTLDGSIGAVVPIEKEAFDLLRALTKVLQECADIPKYAGLNPMGYSAFRPQSHSHQMLEDRLIHCKLISQFFLLDAKKAKEVARQVDSSVDRIAEVWSFLSRVLERF